MDVFTYGNLRKSITCPPEIYQHKSIFKGGDIEILEQHIQKVSTRQCLGLIMRLSEMGITNPWKNYMILLAKIQGYSSSFQEWISYKLRALDILELYDKITVQFKSIQDEIDREGYHYLLEAMIEKLECLVQFEVIYNQQPAGEGEQNKIKLIYTVQQMRQQKKNYDFILEYERLTVPVYQQSNGKVCCFYIISCKKQKVIYMD